MLTSFLFPEQNGTVNMVLIVAWEALADLGASGQFISWLGHDISKNHRGFSMHLYCRVSQCCHSRRLGEWKHGTWNALYGFCTSTSRDDMVAALLSVEAIPKGRAEVWAWLHLSKLIRLITPYHFNFQFLFSISCFTAFLPGWFQKTLFSPFTPCIGSWLEADL